MKYILIFSCLLFGFQTTRLQAKSSDEQAFLGLAYFESGFSRTHFHEPIWNAGKFDDQAYFNANSTLLNFKTGGSLLGIILKDKINKWFIGDASEFYFGMGYGRGKDLKVGATEVKKEGTVAVGIKFGAMGFVSITDDIRIGAKWQRVIQQEFLPYVESKSIQPHRTVYTVFASYKQTTVGFEKYSPYAVMYDKSSQTTCNHKGMGFYVQQRVNEKYCLGVSYNHVNMRYITKNPVVFDFQTTWAPNWSCFTLMAGIGI